MANDATKYTIDFQPLGRRARVAPGTALLDAAREAGVDLNAICGGGGTCGACRVRIADGTVTPPVDSEKRAVAEGLRLACQTRVLGDVRVDVPTSSMTAPQRAQVEGRERTIEFEPSVAAYDVALDPASLTDLRADTLRLRDALREQHGIEVDAIDIAVARELPTTLRRDSWHTRVILQDGELIALSETELAPLGLAVDIGTTKVAAYLVDLDSGETLGAAGTMNPQIAYGEDVMARISYAMQDPASARKLQEVIVVGLDDLAHDLCLQAGRSPADIVEAVLVGNTCMHHLVVGLPVAQLGLAPYLAAVGESFDLKARDLGLHFAPGANVHLLPNIAGFVGADHVSMILGAGLFEAQEITVGLDIGTNTEICLVVGDRLLSCSCASGPAFEGAHIHDGMRAAAGAVEWIRLSNGHIDYQTIDGAPPVGICGSGILDGVAVLRRIGVIRPNGAMDLKSHSSVRRTDEGPEFVLVPAGERGAPRDLVITRKDVNEIQLAKAAIRAGVEVLLGEAGIQDHQIERLVVAGAFGTYLDIESAVSVGMFPDLPRERFHQVGNAAGIGAKNVLMSRQCRARADEVAGRMEYVELTTHSAFVQIYSEALILP
jgi:uncharacterized 2Fe-2S/4Fe-4S cluster protein (DUF4445 family)